MSGLEELSKGRFAEDDKKKLVEFLNFISEKAKFDGMDVKDTIQFFGLLSWSQQVLMKKIEANIMGVPKIIDPEPKPSKGKGKKK